ncbi:MAG: hypothetical protein O8C67_10730 [Candidatus Methanoperedens sp.]|nr:hypothetical protein [Candidatus Methanoperedens sp.]
MVKSESSFEEFCFRCTFIKHKENNPPNVPTNIPEEKPKRIRFIDEPK